MFKCQGRNNFSSEVCLLVFLKVFFSYFHHSNQSIYLIEINMYVIQLPSKFGRKILNSLCVKDSLLMFLHVGIPKKVSTILAIIVIRHPEKI